MASSCIWGWKGILADPIDLLDTEDAGLHDALTKGLFLVARPANFHVPRSDLVHGNSLFVLIINAISRMWRWLP